MNSHSLPPNRSVAPLWIIAGALATVALCLVAVVFRLWVRTPPDYATEPATLAAAADQPPTRAPERAARRSAVVARPGSELPPPAVHVEHVSVDVRPDAPEAVVTVVENHLLGGAAILPRDPGPAPLPDAAYPNGNIIGQVKFLGTPPPERTIELGGASPCTNAQGQPVTSQFYVVGTNGELADVLVYVKSGAPRGVAAVAWARPGTNELQFAGCRIVPYLSAISRGQKLVVQNTNAGAHNVRVELGPNREMNLALFKDRPTPAIPMVEPGLFKRVSCEVHPWEIAYVSVLPDSFFAVTDRAGRFALTNVPPGDYVIEAIHRKAHGTNGLTQRLQLGSGETATLDFEVRPAGSPPAAPGHLEKAR